MSKKHYIKLAAMLADLAKKYAEETADSARESQHRLQSQAALHAIGEVARGFCNIAADDNPNFDRGRFLAACGL